MQNYLSINIFMSKFNYRSIYDGFSKKTVQWLPGDTLTNYESNLKSRASDLEKYGWVNSIIDYKFNSNGFRCDEFSQDPSVVFLGCSFTVGIGMPLENMWTSIVAKELKLTPYNLGQGGGSNDTAFRLGYHWIPKIKPKLVVFLTPPQDRFEIISADMMHLITPSHHHERFTNFIGEWYSDATNSHHNYLKNLMAVEHICMLNQIKFISYNSVNFQRLDLARDLGHPGVLSNQKLAEKILNLLT
jgi:hypothetical protein